MTIEKVKQQPPVPVSMYLLTQALASLVTAGSSIAEEAARAVTTEKGEESENSRL